MPGKKSQKTPPSQKLKSLIIIFGVIVLTLFLFIIYYSFSKTVILVTPKQKTLETTLTITVKEIPQTEDQAKNMVLPGLVLFNETGGSKTAPLEATEEVPGLAAGRVTIFNNWSQAQPLAATTRLISSTGVLFRTVSRVDVPAKSSTEIEVTADQPGASGNIGPDKFTIPGLSKQMQELVYGESKNDMTGGTKKASVISAEAVTKTQNELVAELKKQALDELINSVKEKNEAYALSEDNVTYEIINITVTPEIGQETDKFSLDLKIKLIAVAFSENELQDLAKKELNKELETDQKITDESFKMSYTVESFDLENKSATLKVTASGLGQIRLSSPIFNRENLVNKDRQQITAYFSDFDTIQSVEVKFSPFWVFKAPALKDHIEIKFK